MSTILSQHGVLSRRGFLASSGGVMALSAMGQPAFAALTKPASPVTLNIVDVAGNLTLTQKAIENYRAAKPDWVSKITFSKAPAPELPGKIKAQQDANHLDIDLVLTGTDVLAAGIAQGLWVPVLESKKADLPDLKSLYLPGAYNMQGLAKDFGVVLTYYPSGPLLEYAPERVKAMPKTAEELLAWTQANPKRFQYARPANSGPGRTFLMGLPYILGDKNPKDPQNGWDKTWAYLAALGENISAYPTGTGATMKALGEGSMDIIASTTGWDIGPRVSGTVPKSVQVGTLKGFHWVSDAHYGCIPKGIADDKLMVVVDLINYLLTPPSQALTYADGYFYPGPAVKGITLAMASDFSKNAIAEFGRPEYDPLIASTPIELPLDADNLVLAFRLWDERIGAKKT